MRFLTLSIFLISLSFFAVNPSNAIESAQHKLKQKDSLTKLMIRARAKNAKFIGTSIGGGKVIVRNVETGKILDQGNLTGSTGNTELLMRTPHERFIQLTDENTAGFMAQLKLDKPTLVEIAILAPVNQRQSSVQVSTQKWIFPGQDITGDGVILEVPGLIVDLTTPGTHSHFSAKEPIPIKTNVMMMCGCPITRDGLWDADDFQVSVAIYQGTTKIKEVPLQWESTSFFSGNIKLKPGLYELDVKAFNPKTGNTGLDRANITVE